MTFERLLQLEKEDNPIEVAIIGSGHMGGGVVNQISRMKGIRASIIAEKDIDKAIQVYEINGIDRDNILISNDPGLAQDALRKKKAVVTEDVMLPAMLDIDAVVEATGVPEVGARIAHHSILHRKHTIMLNVEADVMVGPILSRMAKSVGVVYSLASGDQPGAICEMYEWARILGMDVVAAGRGTWLRPSGKYLTPVDFQDWAERLGGNAQMYCSFHDGTKSQIEMAATSNALGLVPDVRGMHEPFAYVKDLPQIFRLKEEGGILSKTGVVDLVNCYNQDGIEINEGVVRSGVFLIVTTDHPIIQRDLKHLFRKVEKAGPYYALYRPYHLTAVETPYSVVKACLYGERTGASGDSLVSEVITIAKKDLRKGELLDGGGGYTVYGVVEEAEIAEKENLLPFGFAYGTRINRDIPKDSPIKTDDVKLDSSTFLYKLRALQNSM